MVESTILNLANKQLKHLDLSKIGTTENPVYSLILDDNDLDDVWESLKRNPSKDQFVQISLTRNRLRGIHTFIQLKNLRVLSLCGNKILSLDGFANLPSLEWLSVSGNHLTDIDGVTACKCLVHLDVSDNEIKNIPQLSSLRLLHTLLLHGNTISSLRDVPSHLPVTLAILSLAENNIDDFSQVQYISAITDLEQLSIMKNPCVEKITVPTSYRPLVVSWCKKLNILDGVPVTQRESMAAEWVSSNSFKHSKETAKDELENNNKTLLARYQSISDQIKVLDGLLAENQLEKENIDESGDHAEMRYSKIPQHTSNAITSNDQQTPAARYRVSDKEKRKRVHAWLGAQVDKTPQKEKDSADLLASKSEFIQGSVIPQSPAQKVSANTKNMSRMPISAYDLDSRSYRDKISSALQMSKSKIQKDEMTSKYAGGDLGLTSASAKLYTDEEKMLDFGTKDDFCYVFDSTVARTYAKKYSNSPGKMNEFSDLYKNHSLLGDAKPVYSATQPSHAARFTKSETIEPFSLNSPGINFDVASVTKYEEYDRRPIKPLSDDLQKSMYGLTAEDEEYMKNRLKRSESAAGHTKKMKVPQRSRSLSAKDTRESRYHQHRKTSPTNVKQSTKFQSNVKPVKKPRKSVELDSETVTVSEEPLQDLPVDIKHVQAATRIQALWRGYRSRKFDQKVIEVRQEVRSRRAEQYISFLCHEVQLLKDRLETEHKMRDLQTEAIRYIWSHVRPIIKQSQGGSKDGKARKSPEAKRGQRSARSPRRRSQGHFGSQQSSPRMATPRSKVIQQSMDSKSVSTEDFGDETESTVSTVPPIDKNKKVDASWKDDRIEELKKISNVNPEDTDEGRGTIVTDGEGNAMTSSAEDNDHVRSVPPSGENNALRNLVGDLQNQVLQLQEAMIVMSSKVLSADESPNRDQEIKDDEVVESPPRSLSPVAAIKLKDAPIITDVKTSLTQQHSAMSTMNLHDILASLNSPLSESELWALCDQIMTAVNKQQTNKVSRYISLETVQIRKDGRVDILKDGDVDMREFDEMYLAPESISNPKHSSTKAAIFSASVVLWSSADWNMEEDKAPALSEEFESLLVAMSHDDEVQRACIDDVIKICEDFHAEKSSNSLAVCSSVFADALNAHALKRCGVDRSLLINEINNEKITAAKSTFRSKVVPEINSFGLRPTLKPASDRMLSPRPFHPPSPRDKLLSDIQHGSRLRKGPVPKVFTVREMFETDPELIRKINILPGQRRKNVKAMRMLMRRATPCDPMSGPRAGIPTPPRALRAEVKEGGFDVEKEGWGLCSVVLRWHASKVFDKQQKELPDKILGYRIYVNGQPKGMVAGTKTRALLEGLRKLTEYRVHIRAVSDLGESDQSNTVVAHITATTEPHPRQSSSPDEVPCLPTPAKRTPVKPPRISPIKEQEEPTSPLPQPRMKKQSTDNKVGAGATSVQLGAVFPRQPSPAPNKVIRNQVSVEKVEQRSKGNQPTESTKQQKAQKEKDATSGDDVIDRVLRRYGINQVASMVPSFASGSSLPPFTVNKETKTMEKTKSEPGLQNTLSMDDMKLNSRSTFEELDAEIIEDNLYPDTTLTSADITPRSQALLAQLKDDLLN